MSSQRMLRCIALLAVAPAAGWLSPAQPLVVRHAARRAPAPVLRDVDVNELPLRPPMAPARIVDSGDREDDSASAGEVQFDLGAPARYLFAAILQLTFITTALGAIDVFCYVPLPGDVGLGGPLPWQAVVGLFAALSVGSRIFSFLDNSPPELRNEVTAEDDAALQTLLREEGVEEDKARPCLPNGSNS